uniref:Uncharacterized protein n=1 Tax=Salmonella phage vB_STmST19_KE08 TaxID=3161165 RepID=A0AAU8GCF3_9CAUD
MPISEYTPLYTYKIHNNVNSMLIYNCYKCVKK